MPLFNYVYVDEKGVSHKGILEGNSSQDISQQLSGKGFIPIEINLANQKKSAQKSSGNIYPQSSISGGALALFTYQLGVLLSAGLTVDMAMLNISEQVEKVFFKNILLQVRTSILEGRTLSSAMDDFPSVFPVLYRATVSAGEQSGQLDRVMTRLAIYLDQQQSMKQTIQQALIYPALLTLVSLAIIIFLLTYAMPKITAIFNESGQALPTVTLLLLGISHALQAYGLYCLLLFICLSFFLKKILKLPAVRYRFHELLLKIPLLNETSKLINASRFLRTLGILFTANVPVLDAMQIANSVITLLPMKKSIQQAIIHVGEGVSIHHALLQTGYFTKLSMQLLASGESSGQLEVMLEKAANFQEQHMMKWMTTILSLFEPLVIFLMGMFVLFIALAILLPIFQMNEFFN